LFRYLANTNANAQPFSVILKLDTDLFQRSEYRRADHWDCRDAPLLQPNLIETINSLPVIAEWPAAPWRTSPLEWADKYIKGMGARNDLKGAQKRQNPSHGRGPRFDPLCAHQPNFQSDTFAVKEKGPSAMRTGAEL
jgi:hypothetical protein